MIVEPFSNGQRIIIFVYNSENKWLNFQKNALSIIQSSLMSVCMSDIKVSLDKMILESFSNGQRMIVFVYNSQNKWLSIEKISYIYNIK